MRTSRAAAKRCSHDVRDAVFFVVSEDGPVTVYSGSHVVASIDITADGEDAGAVG
jgi:DNA integrity scanning protein DisA with diadenylate cyclase activity